jgi:predicted dehydrogenase
MAQQRQPSSRRSFLKHTGRIAAATALSSMVVPHVHAAESNTIQLALIGCGGRGTGAVADALSSKKNGPVKLVAMADVFPNRLNTSYDVLRKQFADKIDVPADRKFLGFDAYQKAIDCLKPGDVALFTTPAAFRWVHFRYAIAKGINVFMEKPTTVDGPTTRKMIALAAEADGKNLKVGVGLMCRHCRARLELLDRIKSGEIGDIIALRTYRMVGPMGAFIPRASPRESELLYQVKNYPALLWTGAGAYTEYLIHNLDECCWMKGAWPVRAQGMGGRNYRGNCVDQNFDAYTVEYTYSDGTKLFANHRLIAGCHNEFASYAHGTKGTAVISTNVHTPAKCRIYKGQDFDKANLVWAYPQPEPNPYVLEWEDLIDAIRNDKPFSETKRGAEASLVGHLGRMAVHTGQDVEFEQILNHNHEFAPKVDELTMDSPAPLVAGRDGKYPIPRPGILKDREY